MKILTIGRDTEIIKTLLGQEGLSVVSDNPDVVITHGGDGFLLEAERDYPGVPKLPIRYNSICKMCVDHDTSHLIKALAKGTLSESKMMKLETEVHGKKIYALNEFSLHHAKPQQAIRFSVEVNEDDHVNTAIGDGVIVATPFGSHAYYRSITNSTFRLGIGIAYNNTTESIDHTIVHDSDVVTIKVLRGPAYFISDNDLSLPTFEEGERFVVRQSSESAIILGLDHFRCPDCGASEATVAKL